LSTALILRIERGSTSNGPGSRTVVYLKGCPLSCLWCHSPEAQSFEPEPFETESGIETKGVSAELDDIMDIVMQDFPTYNETGGGLTITGGEPLAQFDFVMELCQRAMKEGVHTTIETGGFASTEELLMLAPFVDLFLFDFKESDDERHIFFVGESRKQILTNLIALDNTGVDIILRCPIIPEHNDRYEHFAAIAHTANTLHNISEIHLIPYTPEGAAKAKALGRKYEINYHSTPTEEEVANWIATLKAETFVPVRVG